MCRTDASILAHQPSSAVAGGDESLCTFYLKGDKKQMTVVIALSLLILIDFLNLKLQNVKSTNICRMALSLVH